MTADLDSVRDVLDAAEEVDAGLEGATDASDDAAPSVGVDLNDAPAIGDAPAGPDPLLLQESVRFPLNDFGNGRRFVLHFGQDVLWVPRVGWYSWDGRVWKIDPDRIAVRRLAQSVSGLIEAEIPHLTPSPEQMRLLSEEATVESAIAGLSGRRDEDGSPDPGAEAELKRLYARRTEIAGLRRRLTDLRREHRRFARTSGNSARIDALLTEGGIGLARPLEDLDANGLDVCCQNGVLRFSVLSDPESGMSPTAGVDLLEHARDHLLTKAVDAAFDPAATCPRFDAYLARVQPAAEMRRFLQRWFGYSMTALTGEQKLVFLYGAGANGKSVLVDLMARILADYAATAKIESLIGRNRRSGGDATPDLIPLVGARFVRASEPEEGERLQEAKIKELTGGEPILARGLNADFFEFLPRFKLTISGNHKPDIRGTDDGIWRRVLLVPWDVQIPKAERDPDLVAKLFEERDGILNWLVRGLLDYLEGGLQEPASVVEATAEYRADSDPVGTMLADATVVTGSEADFIAARDLIQAFQFWQDERGETPWGNRTVSLRLKEKAGRWRHPLSGRTYAASKSSQTGYRGIRLNDLFRDRFDRRAQKPGSAAPSAMAGEPDDWR